jgi:hypothetical protein
MTKISGRLESSGSVKARAAMGASSLTIGARYFDAETGDALRAIRRAMFPPTPWRPIHSRKARRTIAGICKDGYLMRRRNLDGRQEYREMDRDEAQRYLFDPRGRLV